MKRVCIFGEFEPAFMTLAPCAHRFLSIQSSRNAERFVGQELEGALSLVHAAGVNARGAHLIVSVFSNAEEMLAAYFAFDGICDNAVPGALLVDASGVTVDIAKRAIVIARKRGFDLACFASLESLIASRCQPENGCVIPTSAVGKRVDGAVAELIGAGIIGSAGNVATVSCS